MVAPESSVFCGLLWMQDLEQAEYDQILTSTKTILDRNIQLSLVEDHFQGLDLTNPDTYDEKDTKEKTEEPQLQLEEKIQKYQELTLIGINSIIQTHREDHKQQNTKK